MSTTWYVDYTNGSNANDGLSFATRKQTIESCTPTAGDTVRVMASSDPTSIMIYHEIIRVECECGSESVKHPGHDWYCPKFNGRK